MNEDAPVGPRAWTFLTIDGVRQYGGNVGYDDDPATVYRYDSDVANHLQVRRGDVVIIRSRNNLLGIATIEQISEGLASKDRLRCPQCATSNIKERAAAYPPYRCHAGHVFAAPVRETAQVRTYDARYGGTFRKIGSDLAVARLLESVKRPSDQMSIKEIDLGKLEGVLREEASIVPLLDRFARRMSETEVAGDLQRTGSVIEERRRVLREIALRRGQARFRKRLIARYGFECQVSRCAFPGLVEAAHIRPYAGSSDNGAANGLLLRSDLHTLFDLGMLGIEPETLVIRLRSELLAFGYQVFDGKLLHVNGTAGPDRGSLRERWNFFESAVEIS